MIERRHVRLGASTLRKRCHSRPRALGTSTERKKHWQDDLGNVDALTREEDAGATQGDLTLI